VEGGGIWVWGTNTRERKKFLSGMHDGRIEEFESIRHLKR